MEVKHSRHFRFFCRSRHEDVRIIVPLAFVVFLIGYAKELRHLMSEGGWPELAVVLICFGGILMCYGVALMPITSKVRARVSVGTETAAPIARTPRPSRKRSLKDRAFDAVGYLCGEVFGWVCFGLVFFVGFLGVAVFLCCMLFAVLMLRHFEALEDKNASPERTD
jgi:hypothetical protein